MQEARVNSIEQNKFIMWLEQNKHIKMKYNLKKKIFSLASSLSKIRYSINFRSSESIQFSLSPKDSFVLRRFGNDTQK